MKIEKLEYLVETAREWAKLHHAGQKYAYGSDYFEAHILEVEKTVIELMHSPHYTRTDRYLGRVAALLHDVVKDTDVTVTEIQRTFGHRVAQMVLDLTKLDNEDWEAQWSRAKRDYLSLVVKKADMLVNLKVSVATNKLKLIDKYTAGLRYLSL